MKLDMELEELFIAVAATSARTNGSRGGLAPRVDDIFDRTFLHYCNSKSC